MAFICKASKGEAIVNYCEPLVTKQMEASYSLFVHHYYIRPIRYNKMKQRLIQVEVKP